MVASHSRTPENYNRGGGGEPGIFLTRVDHLFSSHEGCQVQGGHGGGGEEESQLKY